jgi:hypothetical protein
LQAAWNKYGEEKFDFRVVEVVPDGVLLADAEDRWLREHFGQPHCYNSGAAAVAPWRGVYGDKHFNFGKAMALEQKQQISSALKDFYAEDFNNHPRVGKTHTEETKEKIRQAKLANPQTPWLGKTRSQETRQKISDAQRGKPKAPRTLTEEGRAKIRAAAEAGHFSHFLGKTHTEESKEKMRKPVYAILPDGSRRDFIGVSFAGKELGVAYTMLVRSMKAGKPIAKGKLAGWTFVYA